MRTSTKGVKDARLHEYGISVNVVFSPEQYNTLQKLAQMQNISVSEALRQAINVSNLIVNANADDDTQILLKKGSNVQELKIIR